MGWGNMWHQMNWLDKQSQAMIGATGSYVRRKRGKETVSPSTIFFEKLKQHPQWKMLKGRSEMGWRINPNALQRDEAMHIPIRNRYKEQIYDSDFYLFADKEVESGGAILEAPEEIAQSARVVLKCLWVPEELSKKGIARRALETLIKLCDEVDELAVAKEEWKEQYIGNNHCCLSLVPNPFTVDWSLEPEFLKSIDWSDGEKATNDCNMQDESEKEMRKGKQRMNMKGLQEFYRSLGFEDCEGLGFHSYFDKTTNRIRTSRTMMGRSYAIRRWPMVYPSRYVEMYEDNEFE